MVQTSSTALVYSQGEHHSQDTVRSPLAYEPAFLPRAGPLVPKLPCVTMRSRLVSFLERRVARNPRDLTAHVRRILLYAESKDAPAVYGALVDLDLISEGKGRELRSRLLQQVAHLLEDGPRAELEARLVPDCRQHELTAPPARARLAAWGFRGRPLTERADQAALAQTDPLVTANALIAEGLVEPARNLLEEAVADDPGREDLNLALLGLYRSSNDRAAYERMHRRLKGIEVGAATAWSELATHFATPVPDP